VEDQTELDGIPIEWDVGDSNHFVDVFELEEPQESELPPYIFMMHFAGGELRAETKQGPGLYWDRSDTLQNQLQLLQTPFGEIRILTGRDASDYYDFYGYAEAFVRKRRVYAAERIFPGHIFINNDPHQGLVSKNEILLGCYRFFDTETLFPIGLRANSAGYLVRGVANLGDKTMQRLGFESRAEAHGLNRWIRNVNLLPHGGGYQYPHIRKVTNVHYLKGKRFFELEFHDSESRQIISEVRNLPFQYRGEEVVGRSVDLRLLDIVARLKPYLVLKV